MSNNLIFGIQVNTTGATQALSSFRNQINDVSNGIASGFSSSLASSPIGGFIDRLKLATSSSSEFGKALGGGLFMGLQAVAVGAVAAGTAVTAFTLAQAAAATEIKRMSLATGVTTETISKFATMVTKGGGAVEDATDIMKDYADKLGDARKGNKDLGETFKKLGVDITRNNSTAFAQTIEGLSKLEDKSVAMNIGMQLFSDNYVKVASQIAEGNTLINQNPLMSDEFINKSDALMVSFNRLKTNMIQLGTEAVIPIVDGLNDLIKIIMTPDLNGETPLEKAMKGIAASIKSGRENLAFLTGGKQATESNTLTEEENLANSKQQVIYAQNRVAAAKEAYDISVRENDQNLEMNKRNYEYALKDLGYMKQQLAGHNKLVESKVQAVKDEEKAIKTKMANDLAAEKALRDAEAARAKAQADAAAAKAKKEAETQAALNKAFATVTSAEKEMLASSFEGRLKLIEKDTQAQLAAIKVLGTSSEQYIIAKQNIELNANRKVAEEKQRQLDAEKAKADDILNKQKELQSLKLQQRTTLASAGEQFMTDSKFSRYRPTNDEEYPTEIKAVQSFIQFNQRAKIDEYAKSFDELKVIAQDALEEAVKAGDLSMMQGIEQYAFIQEGLEIALIDQQVRLKEHYETIAENFTKFGSAMAPESIWGKIFRVTDEDEEMLLRGIAMMEETVSTAMNMFTVIADTRYEKEMKSAEDAKAIAQGELASKRMTDKARLSEQKKIDDQYDKAKRDAFNKTKGLKIAQVGIDTASAIMGAWSGAMQLPFPASVITGGILTAMMGVTGGIQANNIRKQEYADGGVVGGFNGASIGQDNRTATIREGEMILNARQQKNLFNKISDTSSTSSRQVNINIENYRGGDDELSRLEDMLYRLQSNGRFSFA